MELSTRICEKEDTDFIFHGKREIVVDIEGETFIDEEERALTEKGVADKSIIIALLNGGIVNCKVSSTL